MRDSTEQAGPADPLFFPFGLFCAVEQDIAAMPACDADGDRCGNKEPGARLVERLAVQDCVQQLIFHFASPFFLMHRCMNTDATTYLRILKKKSSRRSDENREVIRYQTCVVSTTSVFVGS